jgi:hypothetical protein
MSERRPYSRVYWSILDDPKFDGIRAKPALLGSWTLLLVLADMAYPSPSFVPPTVTPKALAALANAGVVDCLSGGRYRLHGLQAERERRAAAATRDPKRFPTAPQEGPNWEAGGSQAEAEPSTSKDEHEPTRAREDADPADAYWSLTGTYPTGPSLKWIDDLAEHYGQEATTRALVRAHVADAQRSTLLGRTRDILASEARALDRKERDDERERVRQKRAAPKVLPEWEQEFRRMIAERYGRP